LVTECGGPAHLFENVRAPAGGFSLGGIPAGAALRLRLADGRELLRLAAAPVSYFGQGSALVHVGPPPSEVLDLAVLPPYGATPRHFEAEAFTPDERRVVDLGGAW
jgi:hypothetical protein